MKIGIDARLWDESGVGRYIRNLVKWLGRLDQKHEYILFLKKKEFTNYQLPITNYQFKKVLADIRWHSIEEQFLLPKILNKEKLDLVHFPYFSIPVLYQRPFVVTIHDLIINHFPTGQASTLPQPIYLFKRFGHHFVLNQAVQKSKKIIVPTKATKKEILDHFKVSKEKIAVTHEGVSEKIKKTGQSLNLLKGLSWKMNQKTILENEFFLYVGNAYPHKNLERLLRAFLKLKTQNSKLVPLVKPLATHSKTITKSLKLILVGKEDYFYKRLKKEAKEMGLLNQVIFYGQANDEELCWLYKNARALILPSLMEGFGLPALEAMSCGCLVLASDTPALKEVCGEAAIYFNPDNVESIKDGIERTICLNDSNHLNKIKKGKEQAKKFSWRKMAEETLKIYESCLF